MGVMPGRFSTSSFDGGQPAPAPAPAAPNPDPGNYRLIQERRLGRYVVVEVQYPDATNYEGRKIMIFKARSFETVVSHNHGVVDPHFSENPKFLSPIARFEPTPQGWRNAIVCAEAMG